jgi:hypothetical protein
MSTTLYAPAATPTSSPSPLCCITESPSSSSLTSILPFSLTITQYSKDARFTTPYASGTEWLNLHTTPTAGCTVSKISDFVGYLTGRKKAGLCEFDNPVYGKGWFIIPPQVVVDDVMIVGYRKRSVVGSKEHGKEQRQSSVVDGTGNVNVNGNAVVNGNGNAATTTTTTTSSPSTSTSSLSVKKKQATSTIPVKKSLLSSLSSKLKKTQDHLSSVSRAKLASLDPYNYGDLVKSSDVSSAVANVGEGAARGAASNEKVEAYRKRIEKCLIDFRDHTGDHTNKCDCVRIKTDEREGGASTSLLKYILYETADTVSSEQFIAYRETSEFADELDVVVYRNKEVTPLEVLELMGQGDLPEEVKAVIRHKTSQRKAQGSAREKSKMKEFEKGVVERGLAMEEGAGGGAGVAVEGLNGKKRDRRTIEEIQKEMLEKELGVGGKRVKREE